MSSSHERPHPENFGLTEAEGLALDWILENYPKYIGDAQRKIDFLQLFPDQNYEQLVAAYREASIQQSHRAFSKIK